MSRLFGEMRQLAFVVRDLDAALRYWTETMRVGPFYLLPNLVPDEWRYRGERAAPPTLSIALGYSGEFQIELIQQHDDKPSAYRDFLNAGREGCHHVSSWTTRADYDRLHGELGGQGLVPVHEGAMPGSGIRFAYYDTASATPGGLYYEIAEVLEPPFHRMMERMHDIARNWDGADPIRHRLP